MRVTEPAFQLKTSVIGEIFESAGLNGCIGSSDGTHAGMQKYPNWAAQNDKGFKLSISSRNYNTAVSHPHQVLGTILGHPGAFNDKTLVLLSELLRDLLEDNFFLIMSSPCMNLIRIMQLLQLLTKVPGLLLIMGI